MERISHHCTLIALSVAIWTAICCENTTLLAQNTTGNSGLPSDGAPEPVPAVPSTSTLGSEGSSFGGIETGPAEGSGFTYEFVSFVSHIKTSHQSHKAKLKASPLGKLCAEIKKPLSKLTGGIIPAESHPNPVELAAPGPQGAAAKIKKDQLEAPQRLSAVKALATVDCHWYPEAQTALVNALRTDRDECVRYEAALVLSQANCCNRMIVQALKTCVEGSQVDGNPGERSMRVRNQAAFALERCLNMCGDGELDSFNSDQLRPEYPEQASNASARGDYDNYTSADLQQRSYVVPASANGEKPLTALRNLNLVPVSNKGANETTPKPPQPSADPKLELGAAHAVLLQFQELKRESQLTPPKSLAEAWTQSR